MSIKRILFTILFICSLSLAIGSVPGGAGQEPTKEPPPNLDLSSYHLGGEFQLSLDGNAERYLPAVVYNHIHDEYLVVWHNTWPGNRDIYARRVSRSGQILSWFCVTTGVDDRLQPALAYNAANDEYLVVWMKETGSKYSIWGKIIPWNGPGSNAEFQVFDWPDRSFWTPKVAWNSYRNEYLVVWNALDTTVGFPPGTPVDIAGIRVSASGVVQSPANILSMYAQPHQVDMVYNVAMDEYFLVFVVVHGQATTGNDIYGLRASWSGLPVDPPGLIPIDEQALDQNAPAVATNQQDRYMVVWEHKYSSTDTDIYAREYAVNGSPVANDFTLASWTEDTTNPEIASGGPGNDWLAVWQQALGGGSGYAIKGFHWGPSVNSNFFDVANFAFWENENPAVAANIPGYLIVYEGDSSTTNRHIYGRMWWPEALYLPLLMRSSP